MHHAHASKVAVAIFSFARLIEPPLLIWYTEFYLALCTQTSVEIDILGTE